MKNSKNSPPSTSASRPTNVTNVTNQINSTIGIQAHNVTAGSLTIQVNSAKSANSTKPIWLNVQDPIESFCGRENFLEELHTKIQEPNNQITVLSQMKVISGLGGVGKSETARKYINQYAPSSYTNVIWIHAETPQLVEQSFHQLAQDNLGMTNIGSVPVSKILDKIYEKVCSKPSLFIFDNAENWEDGLEPYLPKSLAPHLKKPKILVTSRNQQWGRRQGRCDHVVVTLDVFMEGESVKFILKELELDESDENRREAANLGQLLGGLPLALQQAVAYIREENEYAKFSTNTNGPFTIREYIELFENAKSRKKYLPSLKTPRSETEMTVYTTWIVTWDKIQKLEQGRLAIEILEIMSFLFSDNIPLEFLTFVFENGSKSIGQKGDMPRGLVLLKKYCMISRHNFCYSDGKIGYTYLKIHRQVQRVIVEYLRDVDKELKMIDWVIKPSEDFVYDSILPSNPIFRPVMSCLTTLLQVCSSSIAPGPLNLRWRWWMEFTNNLAIKFKDSEDNRQAIFLWQKIYDEKVKVFGPADKQNLLILDHIGGALLDMGLYEDALKMYEKLNEISIRVLGPFDSDTLMTQSHIAEVLLYQGRRAEALKMFKDVLAAQIQIFPRQPNHPHILVTKNNLGSIYLQQNEFTLAYTLFREVLEAYEKNPKADPTEMMDRSKVQNNLAMALQRLGKIGQAKGLYVKSLEKLKQLFGPDHPETLKTTAQLANCMQEGGDPVGAEKLLRTVLATEKKIYDNLEHPVLLTTMNNLASAMHYQLRFEEAWKLHTEVHEIRTRVLGSGHPDTKTSANNVRSSLIGHIAMICLNDVSSRK